MSQQQSQYKSLAPLSVVHGTYSDEEMQDCKEETSKFSSEEENDTFVDLKIEYRATQIDAAYRGKSEKFDIRDSVTKRGTRFSSM